MTLHAQTCLCVMAKQPVPGRVKTRLARHIGDAAAAALARAFLCDTLALGQELAGFALALSYAGDMEHLPVDARGFQLWPQANGDLGARMEHALQRGLSLAVGAIIIGTDTPGLPVTHIQQAASLLTTHDAVLGPADDGGFYLLGLRRCPNQLLAGLRWSASSTRRDTLARLSEHGFRVALLEPWFDVDDCADLQRLQTALRAGQMHAPATESELAALGV